MNERLSNEEEKQSPEALSPRQIATALRIISGESVKGDGEILEEAAKRVERFERFTRLIGKIAPSGTAPRTALEQLYDQSATSHDDTQILLDLRAMLYGHWGEWTPALREAEGLPQEPQE